MTPFDADFDTGFDTGAWLARHAGDELAFPPRDAAELERWLELVRTDPAAPPDLAERIAARLAIERDLGSGLSRLLERADPAGPVPVGLGARVRRALSVERGLDRALDALPTPTAPPGLASRVLDHLEAERVPAVPLGGPSRSRPGRRVTGRRLMLAAAAALLVGLGLRWLWDQGEEPATQVAELTEPDPELLAVLDVLEAWDDITDPELLLGEWDELDALLAGWDPEAEEY